MKTKKSIPNFLVVILNPILLFFGRYTSMIASERNQSGNWTPYVSSIAIGPQTGRFRVASDPQQSVIWSGSIAALQNVDWRSVVTRSPSGLIDRC